MQKRKNSEGNTAVSLFFAFSFGRSVSRVLYGIAVTAICLEQALLPASSHPQNCVGQTLTKVTLHTVLHRIGFTFAHSRLSCR